MSVKGPIISVEDDEDDQYLIRRGLEALGVPNKLLFFPNGLAALEYLEKMIEQPFLILCDINMPLMNGLELRQRINNSESLRRKSIPFIYLTTASNSDLVRTAYDQTVQGFYKKATTYQGLQEQLALIVAYWKSCLHPNNT